jgi:TrmH family RNA methyltransferase
MLYIQHTFLNFLCIESLMLEGRLFQNRVLEQPLSLARFQAALIFPPVLHYPLGMIPLDKLARLPRHQRLRKAEKILAAAELRLIAGQKPESAACLAELLALLAGDEAFAPPERRALGEAALAFRSPEAADPGASPLSRRALNGARHILLAAAGRQSADWDLMDGEGILDAAKRRVFPGMRVYLEDIRSPFNVGAMFRAAESFGVEKLWLSPLCADPRHRRALRTAMGCVDVLPWERAELEDLRGPETGEGPPCFALETGGAGVGDFPFPASGLMIVGSEELGVSPSALERAEASLGRVSIKSYGAKGSLNASVAFGIALHRWAEVLAGELPAFNP